jgi:DNA-binding GntR family transcriptional regulator
MTFGPPLRKQSLQKMVYDRLRQAILVRQIEPGEQIRIGHLAESLNVSTIPVREALRQLESEEIIIFGPQKQISVNTLSGEDIEEIFSILLPLEEISLERCLGRFDEEGLRRLDEIHSEMENLKENTGELSVLDSSFHVEIHAVSGSPRLSRMIQGLRNKITPYLRLSFNDAGWREQVNQDHALLLDAMRQRTWSDVKKALQNHLENDLRKMTLF